jgi:hypothetical protein
LYIDKKLIHFRIWLSLIIYLRIITWINLIEISIRFVIQIGYFSLKCKFLFCFVMISLRLSYCIFTQTTSLFVLSLIIFIQTSASIWLDYLFCLFAKFSKFHFRLLLHLFNFIIIIYLYLIFINNVVIISYYIS